METKKQVKQAADGMLYAIVRTHGDGTVVRAYTRAVAARDVYAANPPARRGEKVRVYPATIDPRTGEVIAEGVNALALDIARRVTWRTASRQCLPMLWRLNAALCACRNILDPHPDDPDAGDVIGEAREGILAAIRAGLPIEDQARAGYASCNRYIRAQRGPRLTEHDMRTEIMREGDDLVDVGDGIALLLRTGSRPTYIPRDVADAPRSAVTRREADAIREIVPLLSPQQRAVMLCAARGLSQRQTADRLHIRAGTVAYHAGEVHRVARRVAADVADARHARAMHWARLCAAARARREAEAAVRRAIYGGQTEKK